MSGAYYVYLFRDLECVPRYVGKGVGIRHILRCGYQRGIGAELFLASGNHMPVEFVATGLPEPDALALERETIAKYGRIVDGGTLLNGHYGSRAHVVMTEWLEERGYLKRGAK